MLKKLAIIALAFSFASWGMPLEARAQVLIPRSAMLVQPKHPVVIAPTTPSRTVPLNWRFRLEANYGTDWTNTTGAQGTGSDWRMGLVVDTPHLSIGQFTNVLEFRRFNTQVREPIQSSILGTIYVDENDDYDECDDDFY